MFYLIGSGMKHAFLNSPVCVRVNLLNPACVALRTSGTSLRADGQISVHPQLSLCIPPHSSQGMKYPKLYGRLRQKILVFILQKKVLLLS